MADPSIIKTDSPTTPTPVPAVFDDHHVNHHHDHHANHHHDVHVNNDEINIYLKVKSTVSFKVKKTDTFKKLKQVCAREGVSENLLDLFFAGEYLSDDQTFGEYGIPDSSTLSLVLDTMSELAKRLYIKIPSHPLLNMVIIANVCDTIHHIKSMIVSRMQVTPDDYDLMHDGQFLGTHETLESLKIESNSILYLICHPREVIWVAIFTPTCGVIPIQVKKLQTVGDAKTLIGSMMSLEVEHAKLLFNGKVLEDSRSFASYNMNGNTILELVYPFQVFVKTWDGKIITLVVLPSDDVNHVNQKVCQKLNMPISDHAFSFNGKRLETGHVIASYGIQKDSTLKMVRPRA
ncbi:hypothetical protein BVRB_3g048750 [Beta vulgaris subsp. vulgaris]|nr:hypothetical protein BVRB_3g048750 [Beta vulgaris subsp. vulgaris]